MPQENVESFEGFLDAFNRRDAEAIVEVVDSAVEWRPAAPVALGGEATVYRGHAGVSDGLRDLHGSFAELQIGIPSFRRWAIWLSESAASAHAGRGAEPLARRIQRGKKAGRRRRHRRRRQRARSGSRGSQSNEAARGPTPTARRLGGRASKSPGPRTRCTAPGS
jgi:hypothetical protein